MGIPQQILRSVRAARPFSLARGALWSSRAGLTASVRCFSEHAAALSPSAQVKAAPTKPKAAPAAKAPKKAAAGKKKTAAKKTVKKTAAKKGTKKPKTKKAKTVARRPKRKADMTEKQLEAYELKKTRNKFRELISVSLCQQEPPKGAFSVWNFYIKKNIRADNPDLLALSEKFKRLDGQEKAELEEEHAAAVAVAKQKYANWVKSFTPLEIFKANQARRSIRRLVEHNQTGYKNYRNSPMPIKDDRLVKRPLTPTALFVASEEAKVKFPNPSDRMKAFSGLEESEKNRFLESSIASREQYYKSCDKVYGPGTVKRRH